MKNCIKVNPRTHHLDLIYQFALFISDIHPSFLSFNFFLIKFYSLISSLLITFANLIAYLPPTGSPCSELGDISPIHILIIL